jgi:hypothetical protein
MRMKQELVPLFRIPRRNPAGVDAHATGTLMRVGGVYLMATAAHVFRHDDLGALLLGAASGDIVLAGKAITVDPTVHDRESDPIDFGVVLLTDEEVSSLSRDYRFLDVMALDPLDHDDGSAHCHIAGYPWTRNLPDPTTARLIPHLYRIDCETDKRLISHSRMRRHKTVPEDYIALRYDPRKTGVDPDLNFSKLKSVDGMSGGAIYAGHSPLDVPVSGAKFASRAYVGLLLERQKKRTGEIMVFALSLVAIHKILNHWNDTGMIQLDASSLHC